MPKKCPKGHTVAYTACADCVGELVVELEKERGRANYNHKQIKAVGENYQAEIDRLRKLLHGSRYTIGQLLCCIEPDSQANQKARSIGHATSVAIDETIGTTS